MKDTLRIGLLTLVVFAAGLLTGIWTQHLHPLPPPCMPPLGEMGAFGPPNGHFPLPPEKAAAMEAAMAKLRPQMEAFSQKLSAIEMDFRAHFEEILTPEQKKRFAAIPPPPFTLPMGTSLPMGKSSMPDAMMGPLQGMAFFTIIPPIVGHFTKDLALTPEQQAKLKQLLLERRAKFLDLLDTTPPPSLELGHMGPRPDAGN